MPQTKTIITITLDRKLTQEQKDALSSLFGDALYEFRGHRVPVREYVDNRYPKDKIFTKDGDRAKKYAEVERRTSLARLLHSPALRLTVTEEEVPLPFVPDDEEELRKAGFERPSIDELLDSGTGDSQEDREH